MSEHNDTAPTPFRVFKTFMVRLANVALVPAIKLNLALGVLVLILITVIGGYDVRMAPPGLSRALSCMAILAAIASVVAIVAAAVGTYATYGSRLCEPIAAGIGTVEDEDGTDSGADDDKSAPKNASAELAEPSVAVCLCYDSRLDPSIVDRQYIPASLGISFEALALNMMVCRWGDSIKIAKRMCGAASCNECDDSVACNECPHWDYADEAIVNVSDGVLWNSYLVTRTETPGRVVWSSERRSSGSCGPTT